MSWPERAKVVELTAKHATGIRKAFDASMDGDAITAKWIETHPAGGSVSPQMARDWALAHVVTNKKPIETALARIYADGYTLGTKVAKTRLNGLKKGVTPNVVDWATWKPGLPSAAALVRPEGGLRQLLESRKVNVADEVIRTKLDRIGTSLASSLERGLSARETATGINAIINDPQHALVISRTEMARSMSVATRDTYENAGIEQVEWLVADGCDICQENADASPLDINDTFPSGDSEPPAHPNCECALAPYYDLNAPVEEAPMEDFPVEDILAEPDYSNIEPVEGEENLIETISQQRDAGYAINEAELSALADYMSGSGMYGEVNYYLREGGFDRYTGPKKQAEILNVIHQLDSTIKNAPSLNQDMLTYRGIWGQEATQFFTNLKPGDTFTDLGFSSTSLTKQIALNFARYDRPNGGVVLEIVNPAGTKGVFPLALRAEVTPQYVSATSENEWLLPRDTKFEVVSVEGRTVRVVVK